MEPVRGVTKADPLLGRSLPWRQPLLLLVFGVALSLWAAVRSQVDIERQAKAEFERMAERTEAEVEKRFDLVVRGLRATRGFYDASPQVSRAQFLSFVQARDMAREFPGVRGFGFIQRVERAALNAFVAAERVDGATDFAVRQLVEKDHPDLYVIKLIEPAANNVGARGLDVGSERQRRAGIRQAISTGAPTISGSITLVQDNKKTPGVLLYVPVYHAGMPQDTPAQRIAALRGVVYAPIVIAELLHGIHDVESGLLDFEIVDAPIASPEGPLMYDADGHTVGLPAGANPGEGRRYSLRHPLQLPGRSVTLSMNSTKMFEASINHRESAGILVAGLLISSLLSFAVFQLATARRRAEDLAHGMTGDLEAALRDNEALLSTLNMHSIVSIADRSGRILAVNDWFCQISGYSRNELVGNDHRIVNSAAHQREFWTAMWQTISSGQPWRGQVCNLSKAGQLYWVDTLIAPFVGSDGQIEKYISIRTDITAIKQAEEALRWSQSLLDKMSNSSPLAFLVVDNRTDEILYFNQRFCELWGIEHLAERMRRKELKNNDIIPDCLPVLADIPAFAESCKPLQSEHNRITVEDEIAFTQGRTVRRFSTQIRDADDQYYGRFYIFEDVTHRKQAELALTMAKEAALAASQAKSQFLANMSHELRTPMNAVLGMLTLLRKTELSARQADYASKSEGAARSLLGLLNEILDFSKIEAGKMVLDPHPFQLDQLLRDLSVLLASSTAGKPVEVLFDVDDDVPRQLVGDAMRLQQVLLNLGSNAVKFTESGEVVLAISTVQRSEEAATLRFAVRDTGIGIAPENQARIFSGFTQAESSTTRRFGGTGLGVAISQRFVALMGGQLALESALGQGSCFYFTITLPLAPDGSDAQRLALHREVRGTEWRTLVIDDNASARDILAHMGASLGWSVDVAGSGAEGLAMLEVALAKGSNYQSILVDWTMPDMDGWETSHRIRAMLAAHQEGQAPGARSAPLLIMVTSQGREMLSHRSPEEQSLLDGFLVKPLTASMLFDAVVDARSGTHQSHPSRPVVAVTQRRLQGMRLLLAEDNANNQQVAMELLQDEGALVQLANHGREAVEAVAAAHPPFDVVLMDLQMPVMDGFSAARTIRYDLGNKDIPIVAMTANAMASDREACLAVGMNDHVGKPFDIHHLVRVLRKQAGWDEWQDDAAVPVAAWVPPAPVQAAADAAGIDLAPALQRLGGKPDVYQRLFVSLVEDLPGIMAGLPALRGLDARRALHTLKGLCATVGAVDLASHAARAEHAVASGCDAEAWAQVMAELGEAVGAARTGLEGLRAALLATASDSGPTESVDLAAFVESLQRLAGQLAQEDMEALNAMATLQQEFGNALEHQLAPLQQALANLDFAAGLRACEALLAQHATWQEP